MNILTHAIIGWRNKRVHKICICGPESTGKTTLTKQLAQHYDSFFVSEYIRYFLSFQDDLYDKNNISMIARGQIDLESTLEKFTKNNLFCDTNLYHLILWCETLYNECPEWIYRQANKQYYDLYLLLDIDVPWIADGQRCLPKKRQWFMQQYETMLQTLQVPYVKISGDWQMRFVNACHAIDTMLGDHDTH